MKRMLVFAGTVLVLAAVAAFAFGPFGQEKLQLIHRDGPRSLYLDTSSVQVISEPDTGLRYLDVTVRQTYEFTDNYDLTRYFVQVDARKLQPVTAIGCDKDGKVLEL
ncbi:MAG: hypothetical protein RIN56_07470 [Sporomusaceae bacterium]|nr:hypothetical protein [Sporomusaceae bacterium]